MKVNSETQYMWRAIDHEAEVPETYVTKKRDVTAALQFLKKALKRHGSPAIAVTDGLRPYPATMKDLGIEDRREMVRWLNNRAKNSPLPLRREERVMLRFRQIRSLKQFASVHADVHNHFNPDRHLVDVRLTKPPAQPPSLSGRDF